MSVFAIKWQEDILKDLLRDLQLCSENDKSIKLNSNRIDILLKYIEYLYKWVLDKDKEIEKLNNNWNELEKWIEKERDKWEKYNPYCFVYYQSILDKMEELKRGDKE